MKHIKSHFKLTKGQRNGILFLLLVIISLQLVIYLLNARTPTNYIEDAELSELESRLDSLKSIKRDLKQTITIQPFNPNFLTDYRGYVLGMSTNEIDRILEYRKTGEWINSTSDFQKISGISDSLMVKIQPYLKFPDWVENENRQTSKPSTSAKRKLDLNTASAEDLKKVNGIGEVLAERIIKYRNTLNGSFASIIELENVYGLQPEVIGIIVESFEIKSPRAINSLDLNSAEREQLVTIPYIDYEVAHRIIEYRTLHEGFKSLEELKSVKGFPINKFEQIKLYLQLY